MVLTLPYFHGTIYIMFIDTHCHLNFKKFDSDRTHVLARAKKAGVGQFIVPGTDIYSSKKAVELAETDACLYASVGYHPYETLHYPSMKALEQCIGDRVVAIGECGLDYHPYKGFDAKGKKEEQKQLFEQQLLLALHYNLPVIIHCRDAFDEIFDVLDAIPSMPRGVFHCFSGGLMDFRSISERGFFVGFDGNITYSKHLKTIIPSIPLSSIVLETDAPFLTPAPHRGSRNEPKYIPLIGKTLAQLTSVSIEEVEQKTTENARSLFPLLEKES